MCRLKSNKGFSLVEAVCAVVIAAAAVMLAVGVFNLYSAKSARGTDALTLKTAQNLASVNVNTTGSIFQEPDAADTFPLKGYFDNVSNSIAKKAFRLQQVVSGFGRRKYVFRRSRHTCNRDYIRRRKYFILLDRGPLTVLAIVANRSLLITIYS